MHEVGNAGDPDRGEGQLLEEPGVRARWRRHGHAVGVVVDVVDETHRDATLRRADERVADDRGERVAEPYVVDRDVERVLRRGEEGSERVRGVLRRLPAVRERAELYTCALAARSSALCARFAAW